MKLPEDDIPSIQDMLKLKSIFKEVTLIVFFSRNTYTVIIDGESYFPGDEITFQFVKISTSIN